MSSPYKLDQFPWAHTGLRRETIVRDLSAIIMRVEQRQAAILPQRRSCAGYCLGRTWNAGSISCMHTHMRYVKTLAVDYPMLAAAALSKSYVSGFRVILHSNRPPAQPPPSRSYPRPPE